MLNKVLASVFVAALAVTNWILVLLYGFGLTVRSWWWVIGCGIVATVAIRALAEAIGKDKP